ncbi:right-handed parallel beta-helix repeat-containing protein [Novipirellula sp.]|uniref:right-handed parallel beta-helix repeat-containing protein n=1 Tax=Novipirellula sp. TaxID=2795430 RepID=UPI00356A08BD
MRPLITTMFSLLLFVATVPAMGVDVFVTQDGAGRMDGSSWQHAISGDSLKTAVDDRLNPGDRLLIGSGVYRDATITITQGGEPERPKQIVGVDRGEGLPVLQGTWNADAPNKGATAVRIAAGVGYVGLKDLRIDGYVTGVSIAKASKGKDSAHLLFEDVDIRHARYGFYVADSDDLRFVDCDLTRYTKHGFRFEQGCDRVELLRCTADCSEGDESWEKKTELLPFGFTVNNGDSPNREFFFNQCVARNNMMPLQKGKYKNGDGFVVEGSAENVRFYQCRAIRNQDAGFDLKVEDVRLLGCVAVNNKRNFRVWSTGVLANCFAGGGVLGLWCNGGPVLAQRCTFFGSRSAAVQTDDRAKLPVTVRDCIIADTTQAFRKTSRGPIAAEATIISDAAGSVDDPQFVDPTENWDGTGPAFNSRRYPDKGYHSDLKTMADLSKK